MKKQRYIIMLLCLLLLAALPGAASAARAKKVIIRYNGEIVGPRDIISMEVGEEINLTAETDDNADPDESAFTWKVGSARIALIDGEATAEGTEDVMVEALQKGVTTVTATSKSRSAKYSIRIRVTDALVQNIEVVPQVNYPATFDPAEDMLVDKQSLQMRAIVSPDNADIKGIKWKVTLADCDDLSDRTKEACITRPPATISANGKLTANRVSAETDVKVWAIASDGSGVTGDCTIRLKPRARRLLIFNNEDIGDYSLRIEDAYFDPEHFWGCQEEGYKKCYYPNLTNKVSPIIKSLNSDDKYVYLNAMFDWGSYLESASMDPDIISWSSSNEYVAEVDSQGKVTFYNPGTVTITAKTTDGSNLTATVKITAYIMVEEIVIHEHNAPVDKYSLAGGSSIYLEAEPIPSTATIKRLEWRSSNPAVATVSSSGVVRAANVTLPRDVTIYARATDADPRNQNVAEAEYELTVYPRAKELKLIDQNGAVVSGKTIYMDLRNTEEYTPYYYLRASIEPLSYVSQECFWYSTNTNVIDVDQDGNLTLKADGTAIISARAADGSGVSSSVTIRVCRLTTDIVIAPEKSDVRSGKNITVSAAIYPSDATTKALKWYSSDKNAFTVSGYYAQATINAKNVKEERCAFVYAEADDGAVYLEDEGDHKKGDPIRSNEVEICVYPEVRSVRIFNEEMKDVTGRVYYLKVGDTLDVGDDLEAGTYPDDSRPGPFTWSSDSGSVLSFNGNTFTAINEGRTRITVKTSDDGNDKSASISVQVLSDKDYYKKYPYTVRSTSSKKVSNSDSSAKSSSDDIAAAIVTGNNAETEKFSISGPVISYPGETVSLTAANVSGDIYWFSSNDDAASVDNNGNVKISDTAEVNSKLTITALVNDGNGTNAVHEITISAKANAVSENTDAAISGNETTSGETEAAGGEIAANPGSEEGIIPAGSKEISTEDENTPAVYEEPAVPGAENQSGTDEAETSNEPLEGTESVSGEAPADNIAEPASTDEPAPAVTFEESVPTEEPAKAAESEESELIEKSVPEEITKEPEIPSVEQIDLEIENDTIIMTAGQTIRIESDKLSILPAEADWNTLSFEVENEYLAKLESDEIAKIREDGLIINALTAGETKLTIKSGDVEKVIRVVVAAAPVITEEPSSVDPAVTNEPAASAEPACEAGQDNREEAQSVPSAQEDPAPDPQFSSEDTVAEEPAAEPIAADETASDNTGESSEEA